MSVVSTEYHQYINSSEWRKKRQERLHHDDRRCVRCKETTQLEVHHRTYERLGYERIEDLETLCHPCHALEHGRDPDLPGLYPLGLAAEVCNQREIEHERLEDEQLAVLNRAREEQGLAPIVPDWWEND